uniref:Uncharacterized protein n=1 Tax=Vitrella brassicaformis TaxID=1169539 RepID=A0A7S1P573_9ALVE|mmetsp:Transcript_37097/g.93074  ORF Transcript_37097/g.93074 Transcript_37097/m.93074 type:complete len:122 (+) Transcript_37097:182-547(+)
MHSQTGMGVGWLHVSIAFKAVRQEQVTHMLLPCGMFLPQRPDKATATRTSDISHRQEQRKIQPEEGCVLRWCQCRASVCRSAASARHRKQVRIRRGDGHTHPSRHTGLQAGRQQIQSNDFK